MLTCEIPKKEVGKMHDIIAISKNLKKKEN
jgi:hypothetical protein